MKKHTWKVAGMAALALAFALVLAGCGGGDPKALAKQTYELTQQAATATDPAKAASLVTKTAALQAKVEKLSQADQATYAAELARLMR